MKKLKTVFALKKHELIIWLLSVAAIIAAFIFGGNFDAMTLAASITGATALIYVAKGNFIGQLLTVVFAVLYSIISWRLRYYGEMLTYLGMTAPIAALALISWIKNPFGNDKTEVRVAKLNLKKWLILAALTAAVTAAFYFILKAMNTANLTVSTISVATSFIAASLTFLRSEYYGLGYAANDVVLIILWIMAALNEPVYYTMVTCFSIFFINDIYGFLNWLKIRSRQESQQISANSD